MTQGSHCLPCVMPRVCRGVRKQTCKGSHASRCIAAEAEGDDIEEADDGGEEPNSDEERENQRVARLRGANAEAATGTAAAAEDEDMPTAQVQQPGHRTRDWCAGPGDAGRNSRAWEVADSAGLVCRSTLTRVRKARTGSMRMRGPTTTWTKATRKATMTRTGQRRPPKSRPPLEARDIPALRSDLHERCQQDAHSKVSTTSREQRATISPDSDAEDGLTEEGQELRRILRTTHLSSGSSDGDAVEMEDNDEDEDEDEDVDLDEMASGLMPKVGCYELFTHIPLSLCC